METFQNPDSNKLILSDESTEICFPKKFHVRCFFQFIYRLWFSLLILLTVIWQIIMSIHHQHQIVMPSSSADSSLTFDRSMPVSMPIHVKEKKANEATDNKMWN